MGAMSITEEAEEDAENAPLSFGQDAGLIKDIAPVKDIVRQIVKEAESIISNKLPSLME